MLKLNNFQRQITIDDGCKISPVSDSDIPDTVCKREGKRSGGGERGGEGEML